jgi:hypothetical protein
VGLTPVETGPLGVVQERCNLYEVRKSLVSEYLGVLPAKVDATFEGDDSSRREKQIVS